MRYSILRPTKRAVSLFTAIVLLAGWLLAWTLAAAQSFPPLVGVVSDNSGNLNVSQINDAARPLQALGVKPLAVFSSSMFGALDIDSFGHQAAANYGYINNNIVDPNLFAIVVTLSNRQLTVIWGDGLNSIMADQPTGMGVGAKIRTQYMQPDLAAGNYTQAFVDSFQQAAKEINQVRNPPTPTAVPTPVPSVITNVDTSGIGNALLWIGGIVILGIALLIIVPLVYRSYRRNQDTAARRRSLQEQLAQARTVAADMITNLDFPADPHDQIQYRFLALALAKERPDELAQITTQYNQTYSRVADALSRFNALNSSTPTADADITAAITGYQYVQSEIKDAAAFLAHIADLGKQVEQQTASAPEEIDQAKKALAAATNSLQRLAAAAPDLYQPQADATLKPASDALSAAQAALQAQPPMPLSAYDAASTALAQATSIFASIDVLSQAYSALAALRTKTTALQKQGYTLQPSATAQTEILKHLSTSAQSLQQNKPDAAATALNQATGQISQAQKDIDDTVALRAVNEKALADLQSAGEQVKAYIQQGAQTFDQVDQYAESSWHDIKGNGTEAQKAADRAHALWQQATALNSLAPESPQDFQQASALISQANDQLAQSRKLIDAITERLKNLQESQRTAQAELATADRDIKAGQAFVAQYDRDITPHPSAQLKAAAALLQQAQAEAAQPQPDWIDVVTKARSANDTADQALAEARTQHQALDARRLKLSTTLQQAQASVSRASNFASAHRADIPHDALAAIDTAAQRLQQGQAATSTLESGKLEDAALASAYDSAINALSQSQAMADQAYSNAFAQFNQIESLRASLDTSVRNASDRINEAAAFIAQHGNVVGKGPASLLQQAHEAMPVVKSGATASQINSWAASADRARNLAEQAMSQAQSEYETYAEQQDDSERSSDVGLGTSLALGALGALLGSAGSSHRSSWGGGGFGGFGGGGLSWGSRGGGGFGGFGGGGGGGGFSSGGFGGGGFSSGGFGGGGSSGGGWGGGGSSHGGW